MSLINSPFSPDALALDPNKFRDKVWTASGAKRATVKLVGLRMLWFNTGTLCNITCAACYTESSPGNDTLAYLRAEDVAIYLEEIRTRSLPTEEIGITGGEPFMNPEIIAIIEAPLERGFRTLVLTNGLEPMRRFEAGLLALLARFGDLLTLRVSLDHHDPEVFEAERGVGTWGLATDGLVWLARAGFRVAVAGRRLPGESEADARAGYRALFARLGVDLDVERSECLMFLPEMDGDADAPEITETCWSVIGRSPEMMMCASSRMVVRRRGETRPRVVACVLLPYDPQFDLGATLGEARRMVALNHPHCARFCVLGGGSCSS